MAFGFIVLENLMMHVHNFQEELFCTLGKVQAMEIVLEHQHISSSFRQFFIKVFQTENVANKLQFPRRLWTHFLRLDELHRSSFFPYRWMLENFYPFWWQPGTRRRNEIKQTRSPTKQDFSEEALLKQDTEAQLASLLYNSFQAMTESFAICIGLYSNTFGTTWNHTAVHEWVSINNQMVSQY